MPPGMCAAQMPGARPQAAIGGARPGEMPVNACGSPYAPPGMSLGMPVAALQQAAAPEQGQPPKGSAAGAGSANGVGVPANGLSKGGEALQVDVQAQQYGGVDGEGATQQNDTPLASPQEATEVQG